LSVLLVTYSLRNQEKDYSPLYNAIQKNTGWWWHYFDTVWIIESNTTADAFAKSLYGFIESTDHLLVVRITKEHQGWLPKEAWEWLNARTY
jgi:hypothetical protein